MTVWSYFATNILQQPAFMIGLIVMVGYILLGKPWYDTLGGTLKAIVGYLILTVGSGGLTNNFRPVLVGLKDRFNMDAMVIDPYLLWSSIFVTLMANKIGGLQFGIYRNCQISSRVFHTAVAALPLTKANRSDFE